ncbi:hypothetical protein [Salana multivorans]
MLEPMNTLPVGDHPLDAVGEHAHRGSGLRRGERPRPEPERVCQQLPAQPGTLAPAAALAQRRRDRVGDPGEDEQPDREDDLADARGLAAGLRDHAAHQDEEPGERLRAHHRPDHLGDDVAPPPVAGEKAGWSWGCWGCRVCGGRCGRAGAVVID